ncbi:MAG: lysophospholipid acyltransferase family protein [Algibacter sp.]|uniref:lysophospholipid acyltransferase family protein n=1 Tax=Algibacter sp. TaxID=1872428 RepID=UPI0026314758|nr:lysophospholipid acyltransferase family protein [Algibacter sp.]MDG1730091.1 lysophospholipid acyltransferase family protein [Algibacter sp.]MDG2179833.1 lysophospholipid acyltransferase family protein [Algibacter sp.]
MQFLVYILVYPLLWIISILPFRLLYILSDCFYILLYYIIGYRKKVVLNNLRLALPSSTEKEILKIRKRFYHHLCDMIFEAIKSITISEAEMQKRYVFTNVEEITKLEKENRSIVLFMGHYASWEWVFILQTHVKHKGYAVYKRLSNKYFDALVKRIRAKYNSYLITTKETFPILIKAKRDNKLTLNGFVFDQSPKLHKATHWQGFMGTEVPVHVGAELLAKRLDMVTLFLKVKKVKRGYYEATFTDIVRNAKASADFELTDLYLKRVEEQILEAPEYYFWTHNRWKHRGKKPQV